MTGRIHHIIMPGLLMLLGIVAARAQQISVADDINAGCSLVLEFCADCHVVAADQPHRPIYQRTGPSFVAIANRPSTTTASLLAFLATTHPTIDNPMAMPSLQVTAYQADQMTKYILSLRRNH